MAEQPAPHRAPKKKKQKFPGHVGGGRPTSSSTVPLEVEAGPRSRELVVSDFRSKICDVMSTLEREYEALYLENEALRKRVDELSDILESNGIRADGNGTFESEAVGGSLENIASTPPSSLTTTATLASGGSPPSQPSNTATASAPVPIVTALKTQTSSPKLVKKNSTSSRVTRLKTTYRAGANKIRRGATFATVEVRRDLSGHTDGVWDVAHSPIANLVGTASADRSARVWCTESAACLVKYLGHTGSVNSVRFHRNAPMVCSASGDGQIHLWRIPTSPSPPGNHLGKSASQGNIPTGGVAVSPSGDTLVSSNAGGFYTDMSNIASWAQGQESHQFGDDDEAAAAAAERLCDEQTENLDRCTVIRNPVSHLTGHMGVVTAAHWLADGDHIASASWDRTLKLWNVDTSQCISTLTGHDQELTNVTCHPSEKLVLTSARDTTFRMWDLSSFDCHPVHVLQAHSGAVTSAIFSSKGHVISASDDRTVKVWDMRQMRSPTVTIRASTPVNRVAVSFDSRLLALPQDNRHVRVFDINGVRLDKSSQKRGHRRMVTAATFVPSDDSPDDLYSVGFDNCLIGWSVLLPGN